MVPEARSDDRQSREDRIDRAIRRLDRAASVLEQRLGRRIAEAEAQAGSLADADRARLAAELDLARARERELEAAGAEASRALANAIRALRAAVENALPAEAPAPWDR
jgi:exonuclease VII large subunit